MTKHFRELIVCVFFLLIPVGVIAQSTTAAITGQVNDPSKAVLVRAKITAINNDTGVQYATQTNQSGAYVIPSLPPGEYRIQVEKNGFRTIVKPDVVLHLQDRVELNFEMAVGSATEIVTVSSGASMVNTLDASVSTVVDQSYVANMPLNGRSFQDLILLTPGVVTQTPQISATAGGTAALGQTGEFSVNGQRTESNYYTVDGVSANVGTASGGNNFTGAAGTGSVASSTAVGTTQALVSVDDLQEFRVQSSTYSAEYGRNPGGQFAFETKSGTNQWHGTAYDYLRNGFFDAQDWFNDYFSQPFPALRQNDFGGTLGAPVRIPGLYNGKDKTFFFVSYEGLRLNAPQPPTSNLFVPDLCMRGDATCPTIIDPQTQQSRQRTPADPAVQPFINAFPLPTPNGITDAVNGFSQLITTWSNPSSLNSTSVRLDHVVADKLRLFFRFSDTGSWARFRSSGSQNTTSTYTMRTYTAGATSLFSNRVSNELRLNYSSNETVDNSIVDSFGGNTPVDFFNLTGISSNFSHAGAALSYSNFSANLDDDRSSGAQRQWNLVDTVAVSLGRHQLKFGADYRRLTPFAIPENPLVNFTYFSENSVETNSPFQISFAFAPAYPLYRNFSAFAQDDWKVSQRLNLSMGLRWEINPAPGVTQGLKPFTVQQSNPDPNTWSLAPQGTSLWRTTWFNFAPRLGAAYTVRGQQGWETVLRGGAGVYFDTGQQLGSQGFSGPGFSGVSFIPSSFPGPVTVPPVSSSLSDFGFAFAYAPHLQLPYTLQWNTSIEQALGHSQALTVSYVGSRASRLLQQTFISPSNNANGAFEFILDRNGLTSDYNALQVQFNRRLSRGLSVLGSYTWSHCIDYGSFNYFQGYQRGNCDSDVRHNVSTAFSYDVPNLGGNRIADAVLHHWGVDNRFTARTGFPVGLQGNPIFDPINGNQDTTGLDLVAGQPLYIYGTNCTSVYSSISVAAGGPSSVLPCPAGRAINPCAFILPGNSPLGGCPANATDLGLAPRNFARGFNGVQVDMAIRREFPLHENLKLQFRAEAFNILNHPNFGVIDPNFGDLTFGQTTKTLANSLGIMSPIYQMGGSRSMQFALKLVF